jgi:hypothetical protein
MGTSQGRAPQLVPRQNSQQFEDDDPHTSDAPDIFTRSAGTNDEGNIVQLDREDATTRCQIGRKVAEGSFGVVFAATWLSDQKEVAIKFVRIAYTEHSPDTNPHCDTGTSQMQQSTNS